MTQRTTAVYSEAGDPFELISAKPPPMTSATKATIPQTSDPLRALLQKKRDWDRSGFDPFAATPRRPGTPSDVEEASDRDGGANGADRHPDDDHDHAGEQHLGSGHLHGREDVARRLATALMVDEEVQEIDDDGR